MKQRWLFGLGAVAGAAAAGVAVARARSGAIELADRVRRLQQAGAAHGKHIVILGAGFGGLNTASQLLQELPVQSGWRVTLVDRHNYFLFTPLLYHAATGLVDPSAILFPTRALTRYPHFSFREAVVQEIDLKRQVVHLDDGELSYDQLVIALGSTTNFFGQQEQVRPALTLKTSGDGVLLRNRLIDAFERADSATDPEERRRSLTFAVVGGGATGVELIGAIRGLIYGTLARQYPHIRPEESRIVLLEALPDLLPSLPRELAGHAQRRLEELHVEVRLGVPVARVEEDGLVTRDGEFIPSRTVVWAAGVTPPSIVQRLDVPKIRGGRIEVDEFLQVPNWPNVYAIGDSSGRIEEPGAKPLAPSAQVAVQEAKALARILLAKLEGREPQPFRFTERGDLVSLGRHEAVASIFGRQVTGLPAWVLWRAFYLSQLMGFKNQLTVALDWSFAYAYQRDTVRLELPPGTSEASEREEAMAGSVRR